MREFRPLASDVEMLVSRSTPQVFFVVQFDPERCPELSEVVISFSADETHIGLLESLIQVPRVDLLRDLPVDHVEHQLIRLVYSQRLVRWIERVCQCPNLLEIPGEKASPWSSMWLQVRFHGGKRIGTVRLTPPLLVERRFIGPPLSSDSIVPERRERGQVDDFSALGDVSGLLHGRRPIIAPDLVERFRLLRKTVG